MNADRDRDRLLDHALTRELRTPEMSPATESCLDAETIAAWMDGGLDASWLAMAEAHVSNCMRCQALLGTVAITAPAVSVTEPQRAWLWRWWLAPVAATAAAVTLWMVVPPQPATVSVSAPAREEGFAEPEAVTPTSPPSTVAEAKAQTPPARDRQDSASLPQAEARATKRDAPALEAMERKAEAPKLADNTAEGRLAVAAPPASPAPAASAMRQQAEPLADAQVTARSSPSPDVIWVVGRAGTVMLATDGLTFLRVSFPETVDLTAVTATDERHAIVTAVDGRTFQTSDGGRTWQRR